MGIIFLEKQLKNRMVLASGILGNNADILERVHRAGCGLVTLKSIGPAPRDGHDNPTVIDLGCGLINAVGLPTPGYKDMEAEWEALASRDFPLNASIYGGSVDEFSRVAGFVAGKGPDFIEVNISCPNLQQHGMIFGMDPSMAAKVVGAVKKACGLPVIAKLTPQAPDIAGVARACEDAGADAICAVNTVGPGMIIDIESATPVLAFKKGGLSGPMIRPIAVRCVYEVSRAVTIPVIGMGGVATGRDGIEMMMAGATLIGIGSAVRQKGLSVFETVEREMNDWLDGHNAVAEEIIGAAHSRSGC